MPMELADRATVGVPFAHGYDAGAGVQVPLVGIHPDFPGGGEGGGSGSSAIGATNNPAEPDPFASSATLIALTRAVLAALTQWDTDGNVLPWYFNSRPRAMTYDGSNRLQTEVVTGQGDEAAVTWTKTYTYTDGNLTGISGWVRSI